MDFQSRSIRGNKSIVPKPEVFFDADAKLLIVATSWGNPIGAKKAIETISQYYLATRSDQDATSPFRRLEYLSTTANNLRIATMVGNEVLLREENRKEYRTGAELFVAAVEDRELAWVRVGQPHIIFSRKGQALLPLNVSLSLSAEVNADGVSLPPLPSALLGVSAEPAITVESIRPQPGDSILLLSRSWIPAELYKLAPSKRDFDSISKALSHDTEVPAWFGLWEI